MAHAKEKPLEQWWRDSGHTVCTTGPGTCVEYHGCPWHQATAWAPAVCQGCREVFNPRMMEQSLGTTCQQLLSPISPNSQVPGFGEQCYLTPPLPQSLWVCLEVLPIQSWYIRGREAAEDPGLRLPPLNGHGQRACCLHKNWYSRISTCRMNE